ncbi:MAG: imidazolonepropionase [Deltaproteobacteria bacterium]|nr:imidazolonepropionase [Deltaproteobacteria bacterium]
MSSSKVEGAFEYEMKTQETDVVMTQTYVKNIGALCSMNGGDDDLIGQQGDACLVVDEGVISYAGPAQGVPLPAVDAFVVDAEHNAVLPGFVDCHTHAIFAGDRANEFNLRSKGASYAKIMAAGGGIRSTMKAVREAGEEELVANLKGHLDFMRSCGVTTVEVKSGYGLTLEDELKCLRAIRTANDDVDQELVSTFLGAHAVPWEFDNDPQGYVDHIRQAILPLVVEEKLAEACDIFIEKGAFSVDQGRELLQDAREKGLRLHIHAEQLSRLGGAALGAELGVKSVSHLEFSDVQDARALADAGVSVEILSSAQTFLGMQERVPGRQLLDAGCAFAVATDFNPGSAFVPSLPLAAGLSITMGGLSAEEALYGITRGGALLLDREDKGLLSVGMRGDVVILDTPNPFHLVYHWGQNHISQVLIGGKPQRT